MVLSLSQVSPKSQSAVPPGRQAYLEVALLEALLNLVDRYWSGCKSLHSNEVFLGESGGDGQLVSGTQAQAPLWAALLDPHPPSLGCCAVGSTHAFLTAAGGLPGAGVSPAASGGWRCLVVWFIGSAVPRRWFSCLFPRGDLERLKSCRCSPRVLQVSELARVQVCRGSAWCLGAGAHWGALHPESGWETGCCVPRAPPSLPPAAQGAAFSVPGEQGFASPPLRQTQAPAWMATLVATRGSEHSSCSDL